MSKQKSIGDLNRVSGGTEDEFELHRKISKTYTVTKPIDATNPTSSDKTTVNLNTQLNITGKTTDNSKIYNFDSDQQGNVSF